MSSKSGINAHEGTNGGNQLISISTQCQFFLPHFWRLQFSRTSKKLKKEIFEKNIDETALAYLQIWIDSAFTFFSRIYLFSLNIFRGHETRRSINQNSISNSNTDTKCFNYHSFSQQLGPTQLWNTRIAKAQSTADHNNNIFSFFSFTTKNTYVRLILYTIYIYLSDIFLSLAHVVSSPRALCCKNLFFFLFFFLLPSGFSYPLAPEQDRWPLL